VNSALTGFCDDEKRAADCDGSQIKLDAPNFGTRMAEHKNFTVATDGCRRTPKEMQWLQAQEYVSFGPLNAVYLLQSGRFAYSHWKFNLCPRSLFPRITSIVPP
jgi:hypothetical protein